MQQIIGVAGMVLCFLLSSVLVFQEKISGALAAGVGAVVFLGISILDFEQIRRRLAFLNRKGQAQPPSRGKALAKAVAPSKAGGPAAAPGPRFQFSFKAPEAIELSWGAYLAGAGLVLLLGQVLALGLGRFLVGWMLTLLALGLAWNFWSSEEPKFRVRLVDSFPLMMAFCTGGVILEVAGFIMAWMQRPYIGFFLILGGTVLLVRGLWKHFELPRRVLSGPYEGMRAFHSVDDFSQRGWLIKGGAVLLAMAAFVARRGLGNFEQIFYATLLGTLALVYALPLSPVDIRVMDRFGALQRRALGLGLAFLAVAIGHRAQDVLYGGAIASGLWLFLAAILVLAAAFPSPTEEAENGRPGHTETLLLAGVVVLAFVLRLYKLGQVPVGVEGDEAGYGWWAKELLEGRYAQIFIHAAQGLYWYFAGALSLEIFGVNPLGLRMLSALHGGLGILTMYLFLRSFFSWRTALVTSALLCSSLWQLHFSRFGHYNVITSTTQAVMLYFLFKAARHQRLSDFILAGVGLSISAQSHVGARLIPIFLAAFVLYLFLFHRRAFVRLLPGIAIIIITSWVLLSGPWVQFIKNPLWMLGRIKDVSITNTENSNAPSDVLNGVSQSFKSSILMFNFRGDSRARDNFMAPEPMLDHWTAVLFALGFGLALLNWRKPLYGFTIIALFGSMLASIMSVESPQSLRTAGNITFCYLLVAFALDRFRWGLEDALPGKAGQRAYLLLGLGLALFVGRKNIQDYWKQSRAVSFDALSTEIGMKAQELGKDAKVEFMSESFGYSHPPVYVFADGSPIRSDAEVVNLLPSKEQVPKGIFFGFSDRYSPLWKTAQAFYPEGVSMSVRSWLNPSANDYEGWWVTGEQLAAAHGLKARYQVGGRSVEQVDRVAFGDLSPPAGATSAEWTGSLLSPAYCQGTLYFQTPGRSQVWFNGRLVSSCSGGKVSAQTFRIPGGLSKVRVSWSGSGAPGKLYWNRDSIRHLAQGYFQLPLSEAGPRPVEARLSFHSAEPMGLLQHFYTGQDFKGEGMLKVDPVLVSYWVSSEYGPIVWRWTGQLKAPKQGRYKFRLNDAQVGEVWIDGRLVHRRGAVRDSWPGFQRSPEDGIDLAPGRHRVEVRYASSNVVAFCFQWSWTGADGGTQDWELVPATVLEPEDF